MPLPLETQTPKNKGTGPGLSSQRKHAHNPNILRGLNEIAYELNVSRATARNYIRMQGLPAYKPPGSFYISHRGLLYLWLLWGQAATEQFKRINPIADTDMLDEVYAALREGRTPKLPNTKRLIPLLDGVRMHDPTPREYTKQRGGRKRFSDARIHRDVEWIDKRPAKDITPDK